MGKTRTFDLLTAMDGGGFQAGHRHGRTSPGAGARFHRSSSRGNYKQMHESREDWSVEGSRMMSDVPRLESSPTLGGAPQPWMSLTPSQNSASSPAHGGFMLATNISSNQQPYLPHSLSSSLLAPSPNPPPATLSASPSDSLTDPPPLIPPPPALWGEVRGRPEEDGEGGGKEGRKWPSRPLWQDGWRAQGLVCSVPRLLQHPTPSQSPLEQTNLPSLLDHPRDRRGHNAVLHASDLQQHIKEVERISIMSGTNLAPSDLPPLPEHFGSSEVKRAPRAAHLTPDVNLPNMLNLDPKSVALLLRKSAAAICCHAGYHSASLQALDTLAGVMGDVLERLSQQLSIHSQRQHSSTTLTELTTNIQDPLERALWSCGIQGRGELHRFWRSEVEDGMRRLQKAAAQLHEEPTPSSLPPPPSSRPPRPLTLGLSSWPPELGGEVVDEEIALDDALATDLSIIAPATTPDPGGVQTLLPDLAGQEPEGFVLLTPDLPPRKRLRTGGSFTE